MLVPWDAPSFSYPIIIALLLGGGGGMRQAKALPELEVMQIFFRFGNGSFLRVRFKVFN
ncbi:MAG: hypothetical protein U0L71_00445 [Eggerthellaceae bacterium]|nr:hypothetical protein [Eggerthellaceae bacterium]